MSDSSEVEPRPSAPAFLPQSIGARRGGLALAAALAALGLLFVWQAAGLDLGGIGLPGAGFFPLMTGAALAAFAIAIGVQLLREPDEGRMIEFGHRDVLIVFAAMLGVPLLFEPLGAYGTLGLFGAVLLVLIARTSLVRAGIAAVVAMTMCWGFFQQLLGLQLPTGPW
jgi:hypothetical protein